MAFEKGKSGNPQGRPKGSRNKRSQFDEKLTAKAIENLTKLVEAGDFAASIEVLKRTHPVLKPITDANSLDGEMLRAKIFEIAEYEQRLAELEKLANEANAAK